MTGSLQQKNGKYYAVLNTYVNNKRKPKWICTGYSVRGNKTRAMEFLRAKIAEYEQIAVPVQSDMLFADFIQYWLSQKTDIDEVTKEHYKKLIDVQIYPYFHERGLLVNNISYKSIQEYFDYKSEHGRLDGSGGLTTCALRKHWNIIRQSINLAVSEGLLLSNCVPSVKLPKEVKRQIKTFSPDLIKDIISSCDNERLRDMIYIAVHCGLRRSELCGLKWDCIDFNEKCMTIKHTVVKATSLIEKDKTKSQSSYRTYPLSPEMLNIFRSIHLLQIECRREFGKLYYNSQYVFTWENGKPISPDYVSHAFDKLLKKHGFPHMRFHDLRHACAGMLLSNRCSLKDVQDWLGHADIGMTANLYGHIDLSRKKELGNSLDSLLCG